MLTVGTFHLVGPGAVIYSMLDPTEDALKTFKHRRPLAIELAVSLDLGTVR